MKDEISFHSDGYGRTAHAAINVKFYGRWPDAQGLSDEELQDAWESMVQSFWEQATDLAHERGYSGIFSEGRSGGWMVPFYQRANDGRANPTKFHNWPGQGGNLGYPTYPDVTQIGERSRFLAFQRRIKAMLLHVQETLREEIDFRVQEEKNRQASVNA